MVTAVDNQPLRIGNRGLSIVVFATFFAWLLAFPFEGQILYSLAEAHTIDPRFLIFGSIAAHLLGLFCGGFFVQTMRAAKNLMLYSIVICIASSACFFFSPSTAWYSLLPASCLAGACVAAWAHFFREYTPSTERMRTAAEGLIYSNVLMITVNMMAIHLLPEIGLAASIVLLLFSFFFTLRLPEQPTPLEIAVAPVLPQSNGKVLGVGRPLAFLCLFVAVITINSGLMYEVINPAFAHHEWLTSWYWAVPYIVALQVMKSLPRASNRSHMLFVAIAMIGFAFIFFMVLDRSVVSYLVVNTLMLGACGVFDLFWWSILGEMLDMTANPAQVLGIGLAANVLGVLLGGLLGSSIAAAETQLLHPSVLALAIVMVTLVILPLLHQRLSVLLGNHAFLTTLTAMSSSEQTAAVDGLALFGNLTERERQISDLLSRGRTYRMVAGELCLSENTVKTHIKNIYSKLGIQSKAELVQLLIERDHSHH